MEPNLVKPPSGVELGELSARVFAILAKYTAFPWPVLKAQTHRKGIPPEDLSAADLADLVDLLARGVERFTSPEAGSLVRAELEDLVRSSR